jgi:hypothetical protein
MAPGRNGVHDGGEGKGDRVTVLVVVVAAVLVLAGVVEACRRAYLGRSLQRGMAHAAATEHGVEGPVPAGTEVDLGSAASDREAEPGDHAIPA